MVLKSHARRRKLPRKRKHSENESEYERIARVATTFKGGEEKDTKRFRPLLPIKDESGALINQFLEEQEDEDVMEEDAAEDEKEGDGKDDEKSVSSDLTIQQRKVQIAKICTSLINDPQQNIHELKKLQQMMWEKGPSRTSAVVRKLAMASLTCVFSDIIPGYRIRIRTEDEKTVKLSKEVRSLVEFEEGLLHHYQVFLQRLEKIIKRNAKHGKNQIPPSKEQSEMAYLAVRSLCELYEKTTHFKYHNNIVMVLVPLTNDKRKDISELCCTAVRNLFRSDKSGESTLATIKILCRLIKDQSGSKRGVRPEVLDTLLSLRINEVDFDVMLPGGQRKATAKEKKKEAEERRKMSRGQLKHLKKQQKLQKELKEAEAVEKKETKIKYHTEIIQQVFLVYFRILKQKKGQGRPEKLLNTVLEGLAQFAHLINVDFFSDLIVVLQNLISSGELTHRQNLCCMATAFKVLSGQGEVLNIDPTEFYKHLYNALFEIVYSLHETALDDKSMKANGDTRASDLRLLLDCLNVMLNKRRRQITLDRLLAFIKRLCSLSLHIHPASNAILILEIMTKLLGCNSKTNSLFDIESQAKGVYLPELDDPEHCGASSACLWELHTLRRHCSPAVSHQADKILKAALKEQQQR